MVKKTENRNRTQWERHHLKIFLVLAAFVLFAVGAWVVVRQRSSADESDSRLAANEQVFTRQSTINATQDTSQNQPTALLDTQPLLISGGIIVTGLVLMVVGLVW
ncbi:hypothetical protein HY065_01735 [Candidatus Berkelbacteria bacterium]|nr:hypothetical protein [Candidatus Berkelbacteria bacterium]